MLGPFGVGLRFLGFIEGWFRVCVESFRFGFRFISGWFWDGVGVFRVGLDLFRAKGLVRAG